jgi:hypothetical protein
MNDLQSLFIAPGVDIASDHSEVDKFATASKADLEKRWSTEKGRKIKRSLLGPGLFKENATSVLGCLYGKLDLRGIDLTEECMQGYDLSGIYFFAAKLQNCQLVGADLNGSYLSEANLEGTDLSWCKLKETFFDGVEFDRNTKLLGVNANEINSNLAILLVDQANTQQRIAHLENRHPKLSVLLWAICDYGRSIPRLFFWIVFSVLAHTHVYWCFPALVQTSGWIDSFYFSIVTMTTLGYGDLTPKNDIAKLVALSQVVLGYTLGGLLVGIIAKRMITLSV